MKRKAWKRFLVALAALTVLLIILLARPVFHITRAMRNDISSDLPPPAGKADDASKLNAMSVAEIWKIPADRLTAETQLASLLQHARTKGLKVSVAGARHSMGGHAISPGGIVIDMLPFNRLELDEPRNILHAQAGARWHEVIPFLNAHGLSVAILQSNDDFSIGGSLSVNCHGWQFDRPPIASSVESFRLMKADGTVLRSSRTENTELFSLALGGYGLFGIILDVELRVVPNRTYRLERLVIPTAEYATTVSNLSAKGTGIALVYGRLRVTPEKFLQEGILNVLHETASTARLVSMLKPPSVSRLRRALFRGSVGDDYGKQLRWNAERWLDPHLSDDQLERNALFYVPSALYQDQSATSTDILMECFVPAEQFEPFLSDLRKIVPQSGTDLLNVTVRHVNQDNDTFLRYADRDMIALVMLFHQTRDNEGEKKMAEAARNVISAALNRDGRYYLPYRLHATKEQFAQAYPQAGSFFALKRSYDPEELFQNAFYQRYGK
jgi:FAD/FMN-containing dehydrogenase